VACKLSVLHAKDVDRKQRVRVGEKKQSTMNSDK